VVRNATRSGSSQYARVISVASRRGPISDESRAILVVAGLVVDATCAHVGIAAAAHPR
jgi:hypothetical protein